MSYKIKHFIIYARSKRCKTFYPLDLKECKFVDKIFYATLFSKEEAQRVLNHLAKENPDFEFEARCPDDRKLTPQKEQSEQIIA